MKSRKYKIKTPAFISNKKITRFQVTCVLGGRQLFRAAWMDDRLPQCGLCSLLQSLFHCNQIYFQSSKAPDVDTLAWSLAGGRTRTRALGPAPGPWLQESDLETVNLCGLPLVVAGQLYRVQRNGRHNITSPAQSILRYRANVPMCGSHSLVILSPFLPTIILPQQVRPLLSGISLFSAPYHPYHNKCLTTSLQLRERAPARVSMFPAFIQSGAWSKPLSRRSPPPPAEVLARALLRAIWRMIRAEAVVDGMLDDAVVW